MIFRAESEAHLQGLFGRSDLIGKSQKADRTKLQKVWFVLAKSADGESGCSCGVGRGFASFCCVGSGMGRGWLESKVSRTMAGLSSPSGHGSANTELHKFLENPEFKGISAHKMN
jgi:hypothetical protein